ncbi:MAG: hypothetical protein ABI672_07420 [Vicinamibacteria bacterium]
MKRHTMAKTYHASRNAMHLSSHYVGFGLAIAIASACPAASVTRLSPGVWGGDAAILEVTKDGANVEFECAVGVITKPIVLDAKGGFDLPGTFTAEGRGPTRDDATGSVARYVGSVKGETLTLTVSAEGKEIGSYPLTRGRQSVLRKCR